MTEIEQAVDELKKMQKVLDDKEIEISHEDIRSILGHVTFCLIVLIEENTKVRKKLEKAYEKHIPKRGSKGANLYS